MLVHSMSNLRNLCLPQDLEAILFSSRNFIVLAFYIRSVIYLELVFKYSEVGAKEFCSCFSDLEILIVPVPCVEFPFPVMFFILAENHITP